MEIADAGKWGEGGENINRTGGGGIQHTSDPDVGSLCDQLKNSRKATVCYKHCPNSYEGIDIYFIIKLKPIITHDDLATKDPLGPDSQQAAGLSSHTDKTVEDKGIGGGGGGGDGEKSKE